MLGGEENLILRTHDSYVRSSGLGVIALSNLLAQARPQEMPLFRWEDIDHRLVILKLTDLPEEMHSQIKADEGRIRFENCGNLNRNTVLSLVLKMK